MTGEMATAPFLRRAAACAGLAGASVAALGGLVLTGWALDIAVLRQIHPAFVPMVPNTAACFVLAGCALWMERRPGAGASHRRTAQIAAALVALVGAATLVEHLAGVSVGIDQVLMRASDPLVPAATPGRMALATSVSFLLSGLSLVGLGGRGSLGALRAPWLALPVGAISFLAVLGYLYGVSALYAVPGYASMALHTGVGFLVLAVGMLAARPDRSWVAILGSPRAGGMVARRLLPVAILVPVALGWLRLMGEQAGLYATEFGLALMVSSSVALLLWFGRSTVLVLERHDTARENAYAFSESLLASLPGVFCLCDESGRLLRWNRALEEVSGYTTAEIAARPLLDFVAEEERTSFAERVRHGLATGWTDTDAVLVAKDGLRTAYHFTGRRAEIEGAPCLIGIGVDISRRRAAEEQLVRLNAELEARVDERTAALVAANQELESFSYSVSHDLRAPLRAVDGYACILVEDHASRLDEEGRRVAGVVRSEAQRMSALIDDLLRFSRLSRQSMQVADVDMTALARSAFDEVTAADSGRHVRFVLPPLPAARGEAAMLRQVWVNLIGNAVKFTSRCAEPAVEVGGSRGDHELTYYVRDNGVGFDMAYADKLFGVFQRLHGEGEFPGTGVGLALVKRVVGRHGGRVFAEARPGAGATFYFTLPLQEE